MNLDLIHFEYARWLLLACLAMGILYAVFHYYKSRLGDVAARWQVISLAVIRGLIVFLVSFLLLGPVLQYFESRIEEPRLVVAVDNTQSMVAEEVADSAQVHQQIADKLAVFNKYFEVDTLVFSNEIADENVLTFDGTATNINQVLTFVKSRYEGIPIAGIVLMTDGIYNEGRNPIYSLSGLNAPIYPVAYGDTTQKSDIKVVQVLSNKIAYLGDHFPLEVDIAGEKMEAQGHRIDLHHISDSGNKSLIKSEKLDIEEGSYFKSVPFQVKADEVGVQHYRVSIPPVAGELTTVNNYRDIFINVIDSRQKIAIVGSSPHPDIGALQAGLSAYENYEIEKFILPDFPASLKEYDLVIMHQIPTALKNTMEYVNRVVENKMPVLWIVGSQSNLMHINQAQEIVEIRPRGRQNDEVQAAVNESFSLFDLDEDVKRNLPIYPPLDAPFGDYTLSSGTQVLLYQSVGRIKTEKPLIAIRDHNNVKSAILFGEGVWRWKLFDYMEHSNNENYNTLFSQLVKFLNAQKDLRRFIVESEKNIYDENEKVRFSANIYNEAYQSQVDPSIAMTIQSEERKYDFTFSPLASNYRLDAGFFKPGTYKWTAVATFDGSRHTTSGQFVVREIQKEYLNLEADIALLRHLAEQSGGELLSESQLEAQLTEMKDLPHAKKVKYTTEKNRPMISVAWLGALLAFLMITEWFLRRLLGDY